ncbi:uncharacterized protein LOC126792153 [Argentina anserina]|uniref:uncharacterized protein LOC126792153 n=1 Tax=Argentina anserina TaxID=57926 RepID=UPI0021765003|nr:uncharacterized protein LOC126792153 [Potentilla anserina]
MANELIKQLDPEFRSTPKEIESDGRYMPHFKDCIGAIDGVHVQAVVSPKDVVPYIGRKGSLTQNVMAECNFDMQFTFVCAGYAQQDQDFDEDDDYPNEEIGDDMEDNEYEEDGAGRQQMVVLRNMIAQSLMDAL